MKSAGHPLTAADEAQHGRLGIPADLLKQAGVSRVTDEDARDLLGVRNGYGDLSGVVYPRVNPRTKQVRGFRLRRDHPEIENGKPKHKYLSSIDRAHLFFPPIEDARLDDPTVPLAYVEAEKSALAITAASGRAGRPVLAVALGGCWGFRGKIGKTTDASGARVDEVGPLPDLDLIPHRDRDVVILFDSNANTNSKVQAARKQFADELTKRGARVRIGELPIVEGVNGPDDLIAERGDDALWTVLDNAKAVTGKKKEKPAKVPQGREVLLSDPDPWPDAVDGAALLTAMAETFEKYAVLPEHASSALALWILHAYSFSAWFVSPFLCLSSPQKRCGKTITLIVLGAMVPRRLLVSNVTPAVLFRTIEKFHPSLLIDEGDTFIRDNEELRGLLNCGHTRTTAMVIRAVGDDHEPRAFSTWCPKAVALIGKLPDTLADRAIEISMRRRTAEESVARLRQDRIDGEVEPFRRQAARWAVDHLPALQEADPDVPDGLHDRAADCWRPLLAVADAAGDDWPAKAKAAALALAGRSNDEDAGSMLLTDIKGIFEADDDPEVLPSSILIERLTALEDRPWAEWSKGRPLSPAKLARLLKNYGVHTAGTVRVGNKTPKAYRRASFEDAWKRYCTGKAEAEQEAEADQEADRGLF